MRAIGSTRHGSGTVAVAVTLSPGRAAGSDSAGRQQCASPARPCELTRAGVVAEDSQLKKVAASDRAAEAARHGMAVMTRGGIKLFTLATMLACFSIVNPAAELAEYGITVPAGQDFTVFHVVIPWGPSVRDFFKRCAARACSAAAAELTTRRRAAAAAASTATSTPRAPSSPAPRTRLRTTPRCSSSRLRARRRRSRCSRREASPSQATTR